jgi:hypothetical protein
MSKPKSVQLPASASIFISSLFPRVDTLPDGTFECDPDPTGEVFVELEELKNTPREVLHLRIQRAEELEHTRRLAQVKAEARSRSKKRASQDAFRSEESGEMTSRAAREARNVKEFCEFLDRDKVPRSSSLRAKGVKTWLEAYAKPNLRNIIRGVKFRALR